MTHVLRKVGRILGLSTEFSPLKMTNTFPLESELLHFPESGMSELGWWRRRNPVWNSATKPEEAEWNLSLLWIGCLLF